MTQSNKSAKMFSRRGFVVGSLQAGMLCILGARLAWLQIVQGPRYRTLSDKNRINVKMLAPSRGQIADRFGIPLAVNKQNFRVVLIPEQAENIEKSLRGVQKLTGLTEEKLQNVLTSAGKVAKFVPVEIKDDLSWEEVAKIEVNLPDLPGVFIDVGEIRAYPYGEATAHIIGYVSSVSKAEVEDGPPMFRLPGFQTGKTGVEKNFEEDMRGQAGTSQIEVNVVGRQVRELDVQPSQPGRSIVLSLDHALQSFSQERLAKEVSASAVIMDAHSGAVYALASYPSFDPNLFTRGVPADKWEALLADAGHPLTNKAIAGQYPPASTFKMVTALAGLRAGKINPTRKVYCPGFYEFGDDRFHCWKPGGHGHVNVMEALEVSCDTYFYELSTEIGIDNIAATARMMGLGDKLGFDLAEERPGLVPDKEWKRGYHGTTWQPGETINASIGQGDLQATPLQLAVMTARLVNGGYAVKPWLAGYVGREKHFHEHWPKMNIDEAHLRIICDGMNAVVNGENGTGGGSKISQPGWEMGGKTGTAQVKRITAHERAMGIKNENLPWRQRHHALFVGYAPVQAPQYICSVVVEHGVGGARSAAPIARDLLIAVQKRAPHKTPLVPKEGMLSSSEHESGRGSRS